MDFLIKKKKSATFHGVTSLSQGGTIGIPSNNDIRSISLLKIF